MDIKRFLVNAVWPLRHAMKITIRNLSEGAARVTRMISLVRRLVVRILEVEMCRKALNTLPRSARSFPVVLMAMCLANGVAMAEQIEKSGNWDRILDGEYLVENCTWNVGAAQGPWKETIFCDPATGCRGWRWDFSEENDDSTRGVVKTFPEIIWGRKPYDGYASTTPLMPVELAKAAQITLEYEYEAKNVAGVYDTTTDIAFTDSVTPGPQNIRAKLMIWFDRAGTEFFPDKPHQQAVIGGRRFEVYIDPAHEEPGQKWVFIALLPEDMPGIGELNLNEYFDYLLSVGALKPEWFLSSVEVGTEIASGKGEITFRKFVVRWDDPPCAASDL
ncbi:MAG: hypothetical protein WC360_00705 [Opitutales bacterium]|jgi:hypothetical protein